jgi:flagellar protein FlgJ
MTAPITDFNQYAGLRLAAGKNDPAALREVAGQFEALFVQSLLKNMREASLAEPMFGGSDQHAMFQEMLDQQLALEMANGRGMGLAEMLVRQLGGDAVPGSSAPRGAGLPMSLVPEAARPGPLWSDPKAFAQDVWPHAQRAAERLNVAPEAILAQAALETGWGAHVPGRSDGRSSYNLFGIKAGQSWSGDSVPRRTLEFDGTVPRFETARFRAYGSVAATFDDYAKLISGNPRYAAVTDHGSDTGAFAEALQDSGYATDPAYAAKLKRILASDTMREALGGLKNSGALPTTTPGGRFAAGTE